MTFHTRAYNCQKILYGKDTMERNDSHQSWLFGSWTISCLLVLSGLVVADGCGTPLGSDTEVSEQNVRIAAQVKMALVQESGLNAAPIDIQVRDGIVTLGGFVEHEAQRESAKHAAQQIRGVKAVVNNIKIK